MQVKTAQSRTAVASSTFQRAQKQLSRAKKQTKKVVRRVTPRGPPADELWLPNAQRPFWLDGSLPGDRGFDPLGLAKPKSYIQFGLDVGDKKGDVIGDFKAGDRYQASSPIAPWNDAFGLDRFRENEIINGRWAMLACLGILVNEAVTGVPWHLAGKVEMDRGSSYWGQPLPFTVSQTVFLEVLLVGSAEIFRSQAQDVEDRIYPGGIFDPLKLATSESEFELRESEVKHCRLAMTAFAGLSLQAMVRGTGAFASIAEAASESVVDVPPLPLPAT